MPLTKLIYGAGRIPKASEFSLGEIIVNVDDSKVYSKSKKNIVFEIGSTTGIDGSTSTPGFTTASISASGFFTSTDTPNLIISGGTGISVTTGSNNNILITATGDSEVTNTINAETASYVLSTGIDGTLFEFINDAEQGDIFFDTTEISVNGTVGAIASGLNETSNVTFAQVSSSGLLFASLSLNDNNFNTVVYNPNTGQFYYTGSYGGGGGSGGVDNDWFIDTGVKLTSSLDVYVEGIISSSQYLVLKPQDNTNGVTGGFIYSSSNDFYLGFS